MIDIECTCNDCGGTLEYNVQYNKLDVEIIVYICPWCRDTAYDDGVQRGLDEAAE